MSEAPSITRSELIHAAEFATEDAPVELREQVMEVARTVEVVSLGWRGGTRGRWCGCLIGTLRMRRGEEAEPPDGEDEWNIGLDFLEGLDIATHGRARRWGMQTPIRVVEDGDE